MNIALSAALRSFVDTQVESGRYLDASDVVREALRRMEAQSHSFGALHGGLGDADIMGMAFVVLMEAAKSAREDLKAVMESVKAINAAKRDLRELLGKVNRDVTANADREREDGELDFSRGLGSERAYHRVPLPRLDPDAPGGVALVPTDLYPGRLRRFGELEMILIEAKNKLDSMSEMGEMESLRLQMAMDRVAKIESALSNLLKKTSDTAETIIKNIK